MKFYILYNPLAGSGSCTKKAQILAQQNNAECTIIDMTLADNYDSIVEKAANNDKIIICGGDGTLNHFINKVTIDNLNRDIYYYPAGTGNDFFNDVGGADKDGLIKINDYIKNLPSVHTENGKQFFIFFGMIKSTLLTYYKYQLYIYTMFDNFVVIYIYNCKII